MHLFIVLFLKIYLIYYFIVFFKKDFIYLFMRDTERERKAETQAGEAGSTQVAQHGT